MKLYLIGHDYRFAAEEAVVALLGAPPDAVILGEKPPRFRASAARGCVACGDAPLGAAVAVASPDAATVGRGCSATDAGASCENAAAVGRGDKRSAGNASAAAETPAAPNKGCTTDRPPVTAAAEDSLVTRLTTTERGGTATAILRIGGGCVRARAGYTSEGLSDREIVRRRQHALKLAIARAVSKQRGGLGAWGALTGMRPTKLARRLIAESGSAGAFRELQRHYLLKPERAELVVRAAEQGIAAEQRLGDGYMLYLGVPFCPTRCAYCSFVSEPTAKSGALVEPYVQKLLQEIAAKGEIMRKTGRKCAAVYFGGGTPTTLSASRLERVIGAVRDAFNLEKNCEFTVEAGRPDTIDAEKLRVLASGGVTRISINPQSMEAAVLAAAKRPHSPEDVERVYKLARKVANFEINCDLIAGLEADSSEGFARSIDRILALDPENITIHTLARKRGSTLNRLTAEGAEIHLPQPDEVVQMLAESYPKLEKKGYFPYYLYRQKYTVAPLENTGWAKAGTVCIYNTLVMEEIGLTVALGAGGITKLVNGERVERLTNPKFAAEYIAHDITKSCSALAKQLGVIE